MVSRRRVIFRARRAPVIYEYPRRHEDPRGAAILEREITAGIHALRHDPSVEICLKGKFSSILERDLLREYINAFFIDVLLLVILR